MITKFNIFERLGYNDDVSKLAEYIYTQYNKKERKIDLREYSKKNLPFFINAIEIDEYYDEENNSPMSVDFKDGYYQKTKNIILKINIFYDVKLSSLEHEMKHVYDYLITGGDVSKLNNYKDVGKFTRLVFANVNKNIDDFLRLLYFINQQEITAYYQQDVKIFKEEKNRYIDIDEYLKNSKLYQIYTYLKNNDMYDLIDSMTEIEKLSIMNISDNIDKADIERNKVKGLKKYVKYLKDKIIKKSEEQEYTIYKTEEINNFFNKYVDLFDKQKKEYLRYIGRLHSYFN
jgi:hypothetical protein